MSDERTNLSPEEELAALDAEIEAQLDAEAQQSEPSAEWFVIHSYSGMENKVKKNIEHRAESMGMTDHILDVVVPTETEIEIRSGVRKEIERRVFPGYILVNMIMDEDSWYVVRNSPGVTGFVGMGNKPTALREEEVEKIMQRIESDLAPVFLDSVRQKVPNCLPPINRAVTVAGHLSFSKMQLSQP